MDFHDLEHQTVIDLRKMAAQYDDLKGVAGLKKEELLALLCEKLGIDTHVHVPTGIGRHTIKVRIQELKQKRNDALAAHDAAALDAARREIKSNKRKLRRLISRATRKEQTAPRTAEAAG